MNSDPDLTETVQASAGNSVASTGDAGPTAKPRFSFAAIIGAALAILFVLPWTEPVTFRHWGFARIGMGAKIGAGMAFCALVLGVVGFAQTSGKARRGRILAIVAILLGMAGGLLQSTSASVVKRQAARRARMVGVNAAALLGSRPSEAEANTEAWLDKIASEGFRESVSTAALARWVGGEIDRHGVFTNIKPLREATRLEGDGLVIPYAGTAGNTEVPVQIVIIVKDRQFRVDDIRVDGSSPRK